MWRLSILLVIFLIIHRENINLAYGRNEHEEEDEFFKQCPPSTCGRGGPEIRYPYRLSSKPSNCGVPGAGSILFFKLLCAEYKTYGNWDSFSRCNEFIVGMELTCSGNNTILHHPNVGPCQVINLDYSNGEITVELKEHVSVCPVQNLSSINLTTMIYQPYRTTTLNLVSCPKDKINQSHLPLMFSSRPIPCRTNSNQLIYLVDNIYDLSDMLPSCVVMSNNITMPVPNNPSTYYYSNLPQFTDDSNGPEEGTQVYLNATLVWSGADECKACEAVGKQCSPNTTSLCNRRNAKVIEATSVVGFIVLLSVASIMYYFYRSSGTKDYLKHEELLAKYQKKVTRYSFSEIKKMTNRFKDKLGQGGYGSVYKGELPNGILVAVKIIERSNTDGKDFINEVSTIGTSIHHFNVVRLLGFCSEGDRRALVYEFLPNGSLDRYISTKVVNNTDDPFKEETLLKIVRGVASGIRYLHEGGNLRILHFDIKPHNILLDHNLNPKVSDFGLAKLCSKDHTNVTVTAAKGTIGYIAPEVFSRNFGNVSHKSDVYSFGMVILKMVVGEINLEPDLETGQSEVYYPELIYEDLVKKKDIESSIEVSTNGEEIVKRLIIVAFWCIQWNPTLRPSMTRVVQMLDCDFESLEIPPKPFVS